MTDRYKMKFNKGRYGINKVDLAEWLTELNIAYEKNILRDEMFELLMQNGIKPMDCYNRFPHYFGVIKNDYVQRFRLTDSEYNRLKRTKFLKEVSKIESSYVKNGMTGFCAKQFFELREEELRGVIPPEDKAKSERAKAARIKGLTCVRCGEVQTHYSRISKEKLCGTCIYVARCDEFLNSDNYVILDTETTELARLYELSRNTVYKYIRIVEDCSEFKKAK